MKNIIEVNHLSKSYGIEAAPNIQVLFHSQKSVQKAFLKDHAYAVPYFVIIRVKDVSLFVKQGKLFAFLGPNGAGKSTTINSICTFLKPDQFWSGGPVLW